MKHCIKKLFTFLLALMAGTGILFAESGTCGAEGDNLTWDLTDGVLTISGTGAMKDYAEYDTNAPWYLQGYNGNVKSVVINDGATHIGDYAFHKCKALTSVTIPSSVTSIGEGAFKNCSKLASLEIPSGVTGIGASAFCNCSVLAAVNIPNGVTSIEKSTFAGCSALTSIDIPSGVTNIGEDAFSSCSALTAVTIPNGVTSIEKSTFYGCNALTSVTIPNSVTSIGASAFYSCYNLASIEIPSGVTSIGGSAFSGCSALTSVEIPSGVTSIGSSVFHGCKGLTSITIPNTVTSIEYAAFESCKGLTSVTIPNSVTSLGKQAFQECTALTSVTIGDGVTSIEDFAFYKCSALTTATIGKSVTNIGYYAFHSCEKLSEVNIPDSVTTIGNSAFYGCHLSAVTLPKSLTTLGNSVFVNSILKTIDVDPENPNFSSVDGVVFNKDQTVLLVYPTNKGVYTIPNSVISIGDYAFAYSAIKTLTIHSNLLEIGNYAFCNCGVLDLITCRAQIPPVCGDNCFSNAAKFRLDVPAGSVEGYKYTAPWSYAASINAIPEIPVSGTCGDNLTWTLDENGLLTISGTGDMTSWSDNWRVPWYDYLKYVSVDSIVLEEGVTCIGSYAFSTCKFKSIAIPNSVKTIYSKAFYGCESLESVTMGNSVETIREEAFSGCKGLKTVTLGSNVKWIMDKAFNGCSSLTSIELPWRVYTISPYAFYGCSSLASVTLTENVESIDKYAFAGCTSLTEFSFPSKVTSISECAFSGCTSLSSITISKNIEYIYHNAFDGCSALTSIVVEEGNPKFDSRDNCNAIIYTEVNGLYFGCKTTVIPKDITEIMDMAFLGCTGLTEITIPENVVEIGEKAFADCKNLKTVFCYAVEPPACGTDVFKSTGYGDLYVPEASVEAYSNSESWINAFSSIKAIPVPYGTCGDNVIWDFTDGVLTISGTGDMSWSFFQVPWESYSASIRSVVIGEGVTNMGAYGAYSGCTNLTTISFSSTVSRFDYADFTSCTALETFIVAEDNATFCAVDGVLFTKDQKTISQYPIGRKQVEYIVPETVDSIGYAAFGMCENLKAVTIPATMTKIGQYAFYGCTGLTSIVSYAAVPPHCWDYCFEYMDNENVTVLVPKASLALYQNADGWNSFKNIQVNPVVASGTCGAEGDNLTWVLDKDSLLTISGTGAMADKVASWIPFRAAVKTIVMEDGVTSIGDEAFAECANLSTISIPNTVKSIGEGAFINCSSLPAITIPEEITSIKDNTFSGCAKLTGLIFPNTLTEIGKSAFAGSGLTSLVVPLHVTKIGEKAFSGCTGLTAINAQVVTPPECGANAFANVDKSITLFVPEESVEDYKKAKEWKDFTNVVGVDCALGSGTFGEKDKFTWKLTCSGTLLINGSGEMSRGASTIPWKDYASSVKSIVISEGVTVIGGSGGSIFSGLENLESLSLPNSLKVIKNNFDFCPKLATVSIPNSVTEIDGSLNSCPGLETIIFGYAVKTIHESFEGSLSKHPEIICFAVNPPGNLQNSFKDDTHYGATLYVPNASLSIYKSNIPWGYFSPILPLSSRPDTHIIASGTAGNGITWELDSNGILTIKGKGDMSSWGIPAPASVGKHYIPTDEPSAPWYPYHSDILYVVIEGGITSIGDNAFYGCTDIQSITCYATTPPACGDGAFEGIDPSIPLNVPENAVEAYQGANQWKEFDVQADENQSPTAIDKVQSDNVPCTKVLRNGQLYLLYDGHIFDVRGQIVE